MKDKLCILVNSLAGGGAEKVALTLFKEYQRQKREVVLLCLEKNDVYSIAGVKVKYLSDQTGNKESAAKKLFSLFTFAVALKRFVKEQEISLVQSHIYRSNYVNVLAQKLGSRHRSQIANHGIASRYLHQGVQGKINLLLIRWLYPAATELICPSRGMLDDLKNLAVKVPQSRVIGNPFNVDKILLLSHERILENEFLLRKNRRYLISVGRLETVKHPQQIVRALKPLVDKFPDLELLFLGDGTEKSSLKKLATKLGLVEKVHFLGQVDNPFKYLSRCDVFVSASEFEGFSNVIVEALISGVPVVSTDCPTGPREILTNAGELAVSIQPGEIELANWGTLVPVGDTHSLATAIEYTMNDENADQRSSKRIERARDFDVVKVADNYLAYG